MRIELESVSYTYAPLSKKERKRGLEPSYALRNLSFTIESGELLAIAGPTGSGKSTLMQLLAGLTQPSAGRITQAGSQATPNTAPQSSNGQKHSKEIGFVFQHPEQQLFAQTVFDDVAFGPRNIGVPAAEIEQRVRESLDAVQLAFDDIAETSPFALSGGQRRRVALAGVLALHPSVLLLDEPLTGLDPQAHAKTLALIESLHKEGLTVVMVSHDMNDIARLAERVLLLNEGEIAALNSPEAIFSDKALLQKLHLEVPQAWHFANELRRAGLPIGKAPYTIETLADELARVL